MTSRWQRVADCATRIQAFMPETPRVLLVLGSGLGGFSAHLTDTVRVPYADIADFPRSTVLGHSGMWVFGRLDGVPIAVMEGRFHRYEGYTFDDTTLPVRCMARAGVGRLILTNAAGGVDLAFAPGDLMQIEDHLNLTGDNPLVGPNDEASGPRFPDMSTVYDAKLAALAHQTAQKQGIALKRGIYAGMLGPSFETPAEIRMLRQLGAAAVGMSTVAEAIAARHMGMEVLGISCITNMAAGTLPQPLNHEEVITAGRLAKPKFEGLLMDIIRKM